MMDIGMMWFDDDKHKPLAAKLVQAAEYYARKYGNKPTTCLVNSAELLATEQKEPALPLPGLRLETMPTILPNHYWIGKA